MKAFNLSKVVDLLGQLLEIRLTGVIRYTHYALMVSGTDRIPMANFFTAQADECLRQAQAIGKLLIALNERPQLSSPTYEEPNRQSAHEMLLRSLHCERQALALYEAIQGDRYSSSSYLDSFSQAMIAKVESNVVELRFMLQAHEPSVQIHCGYGLPPTFARYTP